MTGPAADHSAADGDLATVAHPSVPVAPLGYAGADTRPTLPPPWWTASLRTAKACWLFPLAVGLLDFVAVVFTAGHTPTGVALVGGLNTLVGVALSIVGGIAVLVFVAGRWEAAAGERWPLVWRPALQATALLASNYAVAVFMVWAIVEWPAL